MIMYMCISTILRGVISRFLHSFGKLLNYRHIRRAEFVFLEFVRRHPFDAVMYRGNRDSLF